jgi:dienelactone hydrolase
MSSQAPQIPQGFQSGSFECETPVGVIVRRVLRRADDGPAVILMHEAPGFSESTFRLAQLLANRRFTAVVPELLDAPAGAMGTVIRLCIARELNALKRGETGAIATWIRGLAQRESEDSGGRPVGVIGMCFSGGFALATAVDPLVRAVVMSQPALPFALSDLGLSRDDLTRVKANVDAGTCVRAMRFRMDVRSPGFRMRRLRLEIPKAETETIPAWNPGRHSVLALGLEAPEGSRLASAFDQTFRFLEDALDWHPPAEA